MVRAKITRVEALVDLYVNGLGGITPEELSLIRTLFPKEGASQAVSSVFVDDVVTGEEVRHLHMSGFISQSEATQFKRIVGSDGREPLRHHIRWLTDNRGQFDIKTLVASLTPEIARGLRQHKSFMVYLNFWREALSHGNAQVRKTAVHALLDMVGAGGGRLGERFAPDNIISDLEAMFEDKDMHVVDTVARGLRQLGPIGVKPLIKALYSQSRYARSAAAKALGDMGPKAIDAAPALREAVCNTNWQVSIGPVADWQVSYDAADALVRIGAERSRPEIPIRKDERQVRLAMNGWYGKKKTIAILKAALQHKNNYVRAAAARTLGDVGVDATPAFVSLVKLWLSDGHERMSREDWVQLQAENKKREEQIERARRYNQREFICRQSSNFGPDARPRYVAGKAVEVLAPQVFGYLKSELVNGDEKQRNVARDQLRQIRDLNVVQFNPYFEGVDLESKEPEIHIAQDILSPRTSQVAASSKIVPTVVLPKPATEKTPNKTRHDLVMDQSREVQIVKSRNNPGSPKQPINSLPREKLTRQELDELYDDGSDESQTKYAHMTQIRILSAINGLMESDERTITMSMKILLAEESYDLRPAIINIMESEDDGVWSQIAPKIEILIKRVGVYSFIEIVRKSENVRLKSRAVRILGMFLGTEASVAPMLFSVLDDPNPSIQQAAAETLSTYDIGSQPIHTEHISKMLHSPAHEHTLRLLRKMVSSNPSMIAVVAYGLRGQDEGKQRRAVEFLKELHTPATVFVLLNMLSKLGSHEDQSNFRRNAYEVFKSWVGSGELHFVDWLKDKESSLQLEAVKALFEFGTDNPRTIAALIHVERGANSEISDLSRRTIDKIDPKTPQTLVLALQIKDSKLQDRFSKRLYATHRKGVPVLASLENRLQEMQKSGDRADYVKSVSDLVGAIKRDIKSKGVVLKLGNYLKSPNVEIRIQAADALNSYDYYDNLYLIKPILVAALHDHDEYVRTKIARAIGNARSLVADSDVGSALRKLCDGQWAGANIDCVQARRALYE